MKLPTPDLEGVFKAVLADGLLGDGKFIADIGKFGDMGAFRKLAGDIYGYPLNDNDLKLLAISMFLKHMSVTYKGSIPENLEKFIGGNTANAFVLIENFMNAPDYAKLAEMITKDIKLSSAIKEMDTESFIETDTFPIFDREIIRRILPAFRIHNLPLCLLSFYK